MYEKFYMKGVFYMRVNVNIDEKFLPEIDRKAKQFHVSRSAYISMCVARQIQMDDMTERLPDLVDSIKILKEKLDADNVDELQKSV